MNPMNRILIDAVAPEGEADIWAEAAAGMLAALVDESLGGREEDYEGPGPREIAADGRLWAVAYQTAIIGRYEDEAAAWAAHDGFVIAGLDPDALAVVEEKR